MTGGLSSQLDRVAFVMPVWKPHPEWFPAAVSSVLAQQDCDVELIVVDDGNDPPLVEQYPMLADVAKVVTIDHGGASAARNAGTKQVTAPRIRFVDADDIFPSASTATLLRLARDQPPATIAYGATDFCSPRLRPYRRKGDRASGDVLERCILGRFSVMLPALMIPTDVARAAGKWDESLTMLEDWEFVARCLALAPVVGSQEVMALYRRHPASDTGSADRDSYVDASKRLLAALLAAHPNLRNSVKRSTRANFRLNQLAATTSVWRTTEGWLLAAEHPVVVAYYLRTRIERWLERPTARRVTRKVRQVVGGRRPTNEQPASG